MIYNLAEMGLLQNVTEIVRRASAPFLLPKNKNYEPRRARSWRIIELCRKLFGTFTLLNYIAFIYLQ